MITKKLYKECVNTIINFNRYEHEVYKMSNGAVQLYEIPEVSGLVDRLEKLLSYCTNDKDYEFGNNLSYFLYDCDAGKDSLCKDGSSKIQDKDGNDIPFNNVDDLWNYIILEDPSVEDKI